MCKACFAFLMDGDWGRRRGPKPLSDLAVAKPCILGLLDILPIEDIPKQAIGRALFQAPKQILLHWKDVNPPSLKEWIAQMEDMLCLEKYFFQCRGSLCKFDKSWSSWLHTPGMSPADLILDLLLM